MESSPDNFFFPPKIYKVFNGKMVRKEMNRVVMAPRNDGQLPTCSQYCRSGDLPVVDPIGILTARALLPDFAYYDVDNLSEIYQYRIYWKFLRSIG